MLKNLKKNFAFLDCLIIIVFLKNNASKIYLPFLNRNIYFRKNTKDNETFNEIFNQNIYNIALPIIPEFIIDAGSNTGFAALFFKIKYPNAKIICLEIEKENTKMIRKNLQNIDNIEIIEKGLFNKKSFFKIENPFNATNSFVITEVDSNQKYDVESITIDEIIDSRKINTIDILKIDIEGAEKDLFDDNYQNWLPKVKIIMIETHDRMRPKCSYSVMKAINEYNFILYTTTEGTLILYNLSLINI